MLQLKNRLWLAGSVGYEAVQEALGNAMRSIPNTLIPPSDPKGKQIGFGQFMEELKGQQTDEMGYLPVESYARLSNI